MNRLRTPSVSANRSQFMSTQNIPMKSSLPRSSNPISINKGIKQVELPQQITPSKPPRDFKSITNEQKSLIQSKSSKPSPDIIDLIKRRLDALKVLLLLLIVLLESATISPGGLLVAVAEALTFS